MKSWNEIRKAATAFSKRWKDAYDEKSQAQSFLKEFFAVFGVDAVTVATFEHRVKFADGSQGYVDCFWQGNILVEMKTRGKDLDAAFQQAMEYVRSLPDVSQTPRAIVARRPLRRHTVTLVGRSPRDRRTDSLTTYDPATGIETETVTSSSGPTVIRRSLHGILLSTETTGETTFNSYDAFARVVATSRTGYQPVQEGTPIGEAALSPLQSYTYSPAGDLLITHTYTNATDYTTETYAYDILGNRIATTDALGNTTFKSYDPLGNLTAEWGATYPIRYAYDTQNRRTSLSTTRDGITWDTTTWTYDPPTGNCLSKTYADGSTVTYTYTPDNLLLRTIFASGRWKENVYDSQRRLCGVVYSSPDMDYELQLDDYGNTTNVADAAGNSWRYEYGFHSKLLAEKYATSGGPRSVAATNNIVRAYDSFDRPTGYALSINGTSRCGIGYAYDDDGDLTHITATNSAGRVFSVAYTNNVGYNYGHTLTTPSGNTIRRIVERDDYRRSLVTNCVTYFNSSLIDSNVYAFDALSRPTARTTGTTGISPVDSTFAYNNRSEVVSAAIGTNHFTHAYDDIGNHLLFGDNAATNTFAHNQLNQMVGRVAPSAPPTSFSYTPDGGLASDGTWSYAYDAEDQLISVTSSSLTNGAIRVLNTYDYRRRRTSKTVQRLYSTIPLPPAPPDGMEEWQTLETRTFVYDDWNLIHETIYAIEGSITNIAEVQYFWGLDLSDTLQGAGGVGGLLAVSRNGQFYFPSFDNNGNVTKYIDESGNIVAAYEYDDFGRYISQTGSLADFFRHRFSTKYYDPETGLYYYGYRFYSPDWRIWLNRDPLEEEEGLNLYSFCENGMSRIDYLGLFVNVEYDVANKTLTATDVDSGMSITLKEKVYSGNGKSCCVKDDQWKSGRGPLPTGKYLIGLSYVPAQHSSDTGDYNWYRLYGSNGKGGYTYNKIPVQTPTGATVYRGGFNLHTGRMSDGCVTVWSDVSQGDAGYPHSDDYDKLKAILDKTKPLRYKNSNYSGWLEVK